MSIYQKDVIITVHSYLDKSELSWVWTQIRWKGGVHNRSNQVWWCVGTCCGDRPVLLSLQASASKL